MSLEVSREHHSSLEKAQVCCCYRCMTLLPCEQVEDNREYRVHVIMPVVASSVFRNSRSVLVRRTLDQGRYVVVACTFEPGVIGSYLFRVYTGSSTKVR